MAGGVKEVMSNLVFCLNATIPVFLLMLLGMFLRSVGMLSKELASGLNGLVFKVALPALLFKDMAETDFSAGFDWKFLFLCFAATAASILIAVILSMILVGKDTRAEFVQVSYRSSAALLGIAFIQSIYGSSKMAPLMILGSVPLYNVAAVLVLTLMHPEQNSCSQNGTDKTDKNSTNGNHTGKAGMEKGFYRRLVKGVFTNPIILGILAGSVWSLFHFPIPAIMGKTVGYLASMGTPLGLMALGASFQTGEALAEWKPALAASFLKLIAFAAVFLPVAVSMGFTQDRLLSVLIMTASPTTVSCFIMAKNMGYKGNLTASVTLITTFLGAFTLTGWLFVLKTLGLL